MRTFLLNFFVFQEWVHHGILSQPIIGYQGKNLSRFYHGRHTSGLGAWISGRHNFQKGCHNRENLWKYFLLPGLPHKFFCLVTSASLVVWIFLFFTQRPQRLLRKARRENNAEVRKGMFAWLIFYNWLSTQLTQSTSLQTSKIACKHLPAVLPSHFSGRCGFLLSRRVSPYAFRMLFILLPVRTDAPPCSRRVTGLSAFHLGVRQGVPVTLRYFSHSHVAIGLVNSRSFKINQLNSGKPPFSVLSANIILNNI